MTKIGLEIHCQLTSLNSKLFCPCSSEYLNFTANMNTCPICLGHPGTLPLLNKEAIKFAISIAQSLHCKIPEKIAFFRKNYFYPDLPKNYQITQLNVYGDTSIGVDGSIDIDGKIRITRIQLEEDPGRLVYEGASENTKVPMVDYNRSGIALVEIVTEPDFKSPAQTRQFLNTLSEILKNLQVSDPTLEGAMRVDGNVSVPGGAKVEIKNVGSFHELEKALNYEITRQNTLIGNDNKIDQETRHWDDRRKITIPSRSKELDLDYRYFLENDIPWVVLSKKLLDDIKKMTPENFETRRERYIQEYGINSQVSNILVTERYFYELFDEACTPQNAKDLANLITTDLMGLLNSKEAQGNSKLTPAHLASLLTALERKDITRPSAKKAISVMIEQGTDLDDIISNLNLGGTIQDDSIEKIINDILKRQPEIKDSVINNPQAINFLVGKVMKESNGKADPTTILLLIKKILKV